MALETVLAFLKQIKKNNNRDWFEKNKSKYLLAKEEFEQFMQTQLDAIRSFDPLIQETEAKKVVFRIYRDVRFSKDKSPYKTNFGAYITSGNKKDSATLAGYYIHLEPGASMLAGGAYLPQGEWLQQIRQEIYYNHSEFKSILSNTSFKKYFGTMQGDKLVRPPKGFDPEDESIPLLQHKSFLCLHTITDEQILKPSFGKHCLSVFQAMKPFNDFMNRSKDHGGE